MPRPRNDLELYEKHAASWWDPRAPAFRSLRRTHEYRLAQMRAWLGPSIRGGVLVDLGCGGGLLSEPFAGEAAAIVGVDISLGSLHAARRAAEGRSGRRLHARAEVASVPLADACADVVLLSDVLEHLYEPARAIGEAARLLRAGGLLYANTLNRSWRSRLLAITVAEGLRLVPAGTHDPALFVRPDELRAWADGAGLRCERLQGEAPRIWQTVRRWAIALRPSASHAVGYSALFRK